jgi:uncharacterized SAM-binding protein YcdF (DUF218 family)
MKQLIDPLALLWLGLIGLGILFIVKQQRLSGFFTLLLSVVLWGMEVSQVPALLLAGSEQQYAGSHLNVKPREQPIVVLGGVGVASREEITGTDFESATDRLFMGLHLAREKVGTVLVLGGGMSPESGEKSDGEIQAEWVRSWKLTSMDVEALPASRNTREEATHTAALAKERKWERVILVTSAWHMKRAAATFQKAGLEVDPIACDFQGMTALNSRRYWVPQAESLVHLKLWLRETVGYAWYRVRGWV